MKITTLEKKSTLITIYNVKIITQKVFKIVLVKKFLKKLQN